VHRVHNGQWKWLPQNGVHLLTRTGAADNSPNSTRELPTECLHLQAFLQHSVLGIYLLHGIRTQSQDPIKDPRYVGQGASMSINASGAVGIRLRGEQHRTSAKSCKCGLKTVKRALHVHKRLSKTDVTGIEVTVLSLFPYPVPQLGEEALRCFLSISHTGEQQNERAFVLRFLVSFRGSSLHSDCEGTRT
jgi:hypothetical protein